MVFQKMESAKISMKDQKNMQFWWACKFKNKSYYEKVWEHFPLGTRQTNDYNVVVWYSEEEIVCANIEYKKQKN